MTNSIGLISKSFQPVSAREKNHRQKVFGPGAIGVGLGSPCRNREMAELGEAYTFGRKVPSRTVVCHEQGHAASFERSEDRLSDDGV
jgi:hypothetical protein